MALSNLNQPTLSDTRATVMVQNTLQLPNDYPMQEGNILNRPLAASTNCNLINPPNMAMADAGRSKSKEFVDMIHVDLYYFFETKQNERKPGEI